MKDFFLDEFVVTHINICIRVGENFKRAHEDRPYHGLVLMTKGSYRYVFADGKELQVQAGEVFYLPKYSTYRVFAKEAGECIAVNFDLSDKQTSYPPFRTPCEHRLQYKPLFEELLSAWETNTPGHGNRCYQLLYTLLCTLQADNRKSYLSGDSRRFVLQGVQYISDQLSDSTLAVGKISADLGITPEYFRKLFKSMFGMSPRKYIVQLRMEKAKSLLRSREYSVLEICRACGYEEESYFCKEFKRLNGKTPTEFLYNR